MVINVARKRNPAAFAESLDVFSNVGLLGSI